MNTTAGPGRRPWRGRSLGSRTGRDGLSICGDRGEDGGSQRAGSIYWALPGPTLCQVQRGLWSGV